ncbi:MAG: cobalamin biosynthesis protein CobD [Methyloprofundus sp.]|nr:cobalamin biosynthesis protein CobD [Methyloprofundus sp.]
MSIALVLFLALLLDILLGEPKKWHPLVFFGRWASYLEKQFIQSSHKSTIKQRAYGFLALALAVLPISLVVFILTRVELLNQWLSPMILYFCIAPSSLLQHTLAVYRPLQQGDLAQARLAIAMIVSRETQQMDELQVRKATIETTLENGADAVFAPIFWFIIAGPVGALFYRLCNTLDAMWGYKNPRYLYFGFAAARLDDVLNYVPARLTALSYLLLGDSKNAWFCWRTQSPLCESPNAGVVMSAGAGCLNVQLGGAVIYHGVLKNKTILGVGRGVVNEDIKRANLLIVLTSLLWLSVIFLGEFLA